MKEMSYCIVDGIRSSDHLRHEPFKSSSKCKILFTFHFPNSATSPRQSLYFEQLECVYNMLQLFKGCDRLAFSAARGYN